MAGADRGVREVVMRRWGGLAVLFGIVLVASACIPVTISDECKGIIDSCLKECRDAPPPAALDGTYGTSNDQRTPCEQQCHSLCK